MNTTPRTKHPPMFQQYDSRLKNLHYKSRWGFIKQPRSSVKKVLQLRFCKIWNNAENTVEVCDENKCFNIEVIKKSVNYHVFYQM